MSGPRPGDPLSNGAISYEGYGRSASLVRLVVETVTLYVQGFRTYAGVSMVLYGPAAVAWLAVALMEHSAKSSVPVAVLHAGLLLLAPLCALFTCIGVTCAAVRQLDGRCPSVRETIVYTRRQTGAAIALVVLLAVVCVPYAMLFAAVALGLVLAVMFVFPGTFDPSQLAAIVELPVGAMIAAWLLFLVPLVVIQDCVDTGIFSRSLKLVRRVWGTALAVGVVVAAVDMAIPVRADPTALGQHGWLLATAYTLAEILWLPLSPIFCLLLYRVAVAREGAGEKIAASQETIFQG